jgi:aspartate aminotransferase
MIEHRPLASRIRHIAISPTMQVAIEAGRLKAQGVDVVDLGAGEPDFPTPAHIAEAAREAIASGFTKYTANMGTAELRAAIIHRYREDHQVEYGLDEVIATAGGKQALFHAAMALFGPGDEVITHTPGWPTLAEQVTLAGAIPVRVATTADTGFALTADLFLSAVTPRTRGIILNSPTNPTGAILEAPEAERLATEAGRLGLWVVIDLCYDRLVYDHQPHDLPRIFGAVMRDRLVICGSASKAYAMTGWRCGWMVASRDVVAAANALQSHETSNVNSVTQKAVVVALTGPQESVSEMLAAYQARRDQLLAWLSVEPRLRCVTPKGAFYLFPDVSAFLGSGLPTATDFAQKLLRDEFVVTTGGEGFDAPGHIRLSYAASLDRLREGATRLIRFARAQVA